jgi:hypothetical protein
MNDSELWAVALGIGMLGLLLLTIAGAVAMYLNIRAQRARGAASAGKSRSNAGDAASAAKSQSRTGDVASTDRSQPRAGSPGAQRATSGGFWAWVKAWIFALVHAGTVSVVFGGITFFEDLAKAGQEIQRTGTVTFPKQLLPGTLAESTSRKRLSRPADDLEDRDQPSGTPPDPAGWEVVDLQDEVEAGGKG